MGKGTIISGGTAGQYQLQINYDRDAYDNSITTLNASITEYTTKITDKDTEISNKKSEMSDKQDEIDALIIAGDPWDTELKEFNQLGSEKGELEKENSLLALRKMSYKKRKTYLINRMPDDFTTSAWCADYTEDLTGVVATIEVPGSEITTNPVIIRPGFPDSAAWSKDADGQLLPEVAMSPNQSYYNRAVLPAVDKWSPRYRFGTITALDGNNANVTLDAAISSQQDLNLNRIDVLTNVPITYMDCDEIAFEVEDEIIVSFSGNDWNNPRIIGFEINPQPCCINVNTRRDITIDPDHELDYTDVPWDYWYPDPNGPARTEVVEFDGDISFAGSRGWSKISWNRGYIDIYWKLQLNPEFWNWNLRSWQQFFFHDSSELVDIEDYGSVQFDKPDTYVDATHVLLHMYGYHVRNTGTWSYTHEDSYPAEDQVRVDFHLDVTRNDFSWRPAISLKSSIISQIITGPSNYLHFEVVDMEIFVGLAQIHVKVTTTQSGLLDAYWQSSNQGKHAVLLPNENITDITFYIRDLFKNVETVTGDAAIELKDIKICGSP